MPLPRNQDFRYLENSGWNFSVDRDEFQFLVKQGHPDVDNSLRICLKKMSDLEVYLAFEDSNSKKAAEEVIKKHLDIIRTFCRTEEILLSNHANPYEIDYFVSQFALAHPLLHVRRRVHTQSVVVMGKEMNFVKWAKQQLAEKLPPKSCLMTTFRIKHFKYYYLIEHLGWTFDMFWPLDIYSVSMTSIGEWIEIEVTSEKHLRTKADIVESIKKFKDGIDEVFIESTYTVELNNQISASASSWLPFIAPILKQENVYVRWAPEFEPKMYLMGHLPEDVQVIHEYLMLLVEQAKRKYPRRNDDMVGDFNGKVTVCLAMTDITKFHCDAILIPFCHHPSQNQVFRTVKEAGGRSYQRLITNSEAPSTGDFALLPALGKLQCKRVYNLCEPDWSSYNYDAEQLLQILHDEIYPALADCVKNNCKQIAIAPIVSDKMKYAMAVFVKALANACKTFMRNDIGVMNITIVSPQHFKSHEIAHFMNSTLPRSVLQPSSENLINMTASNLQKSEPVNKLVTRSTEQSSRKRQALTGSPLDLSKKSTVLQTPSTSVQQIDLHTQSPWNSTSQHYVATQKLNELDLVPYGRLQQNWDVISKPGYLQVTMKIKSGYFRTKNGGAFNIAENRDVVAEFPDTNTGKEVVATLKVLFKSDQLFKYTCDQKGRLEIKPVIRIPKCKRGFAGETEMKHFLHNLKSMLPWQSTSNQSFPTTSNQSFPTTSKQSIPITSNQSIPTTSNQSIPTTSNQSFPTTSNQSIPITSNQGFLTTSSQSFPSTSNQSFSTTSPSTQAPANTKEVSKEDEEDRCPICLDDLHNGVNLKTFKCKHAFHRECIDQNIKYSKLCPVCKSPIAPLKGAQPPNGKMTHRIQQYSLPGYQCTTIEITYNIPGGIQSEIHPNPGVPFSGTRRVAYLPNNAKGKAVLELLRKCFDAQLIFTVGRSITSGRDNQVTWNDIHHKTSTVYGDTFGYPDETYLTRVTADINALGIY